MNRIPFFLLITLLIPSLVIGQSIDTQFQNPTNLTDKQMTDAKNFVHEGVKQKKMTEGCAKLNNCTVDDSGVKLEQLIGKAYALLGIMGGGKGLMPQLTAKGGGKAAEGAVQNGTDKVASDAGAKAATEGGKAAGDAAKKETKDDYCMMIAMAYETVGGMIQQGLQKKADNSVSKVTDTQLQTLISLKEAHKARRTTATLQSTIYGSVTACYAAMAYTKTIELDWRYWMKLGGATTLTALYLKKRQKHANAMEKVQEVIDSLPKSGDCNPWTGTSCFCSEATSKDAYPSQYQEVCVLNNGDFTTPNVTAGCVANNSNKLEFDETCKCKQTNTCMKSNLTSMKTSIPAVANLMNEANKGFEMLNNGLFEEGKMVSYSNGAAAFGGKIKSTVDKKDIPKVNLTPEQKKVADALSPYMSGEMAAAAAASPDGFKGGVSDAGVASVSALPPAVKKKLAEAIDVNYSQGSGNASGTSDTPEFTMPAFPGQEAQSTGGTEIVSFAEQAVDKADVSNAPDTPIFDIISNRYKRSGLYKLNSIEK